MRELSESRDAYKKIALPDWTERMIESVISENLMPEWFSPSNKENANRSDGMSKLSKNLSYEEWLLIKNS